MMLELEIKNIGKSFGAVEVLRDISLSVERGDFLVLVGPSGCGKSTLLRLIAGLERPDRGEIKINGQNMEAIEPQHRDVAMVFQNYALYPQMSVEENLSFGLRIKKIPAKEIKVRVQEVAQILQIESLLARKPKQLSGGQRQRVALGRALARRAPIILFDEPLSNLDAHLRNQMRLEIKKIQKQTGNTVIYVTHDQVEATTLGDRIAILNRGNLEQVDHPERIYREPANKFVASFIGAPEINFFDGQLFKLTSGDAQYSWQGRLDYSIPQLQFQEELMTQDVILGVRPEDWQIDGSESQGLQGCVELIENIGSHQILHVNSNDSYLRILSTQGKHFDLGQNIKMKPKIQGLMFFEKQSGRRLKAVAKEL